MHGCYIHTHRRTDFPSTIVWWHDYDIIKRRGCNHCICTSGPSHASRIGVFTTPSHHHRCTVTCSCIHIGRLSSWPHTCIASRPGAVAVRTPTGHAESLYINMRDPEASFSSRAKKTNKASPPPTGRAEVRPCVCELMHRLHRHFAIICAHTARIHWVSKQRSCRGPGIPQEAGPHSEEGTRPLRCREGPLSAAIPHRTTYTCSMICTACYMNASGQCMWVRGRERERMIGD